MSYRLAMVFFFHLWTGALGNATNAPAPEDNRPTKDELRARIVELAQLEASASPGEVEVAIERIKVSGPSERVQCLLAELYPESPGPERLVILHVLNRVGTEQALQALGPIAADFGVARPKHPNDMSFASYYVLEKFMHLGWKKLPPEREGKLRDKKQGESKEDQENKARTEEDPDKPTRSSRDGFIHTGSRADRMAVRRLIVDQKLNARAEGKDSYQLPVVDETDWIRILGHHAFVRLRGESSGVDYLFIKSKKGQWMLLATLGRWVN